jgi:hypothetical protein
LDRLARSLKDLVSLVNEIQEKGGALHSLNDQIDTAQQGVEKAAGGTVYLVLDTALPLDEVLPAYYRGYRFDPPLPLEYDHFEVTESIREEACRFMGLERNQVMKQFNGRPYARPIPLDWSDADRRIRHQALEDWQDRLFDEGRSLWEVWGPEVERTTERLRALCRM